MSIRENNKIKTRKALLKSARRLFQSMGYDETMMSEIARGAEISDATLYNYFPTKKDLLIGIAREEAGELKEFLSSDLEAGKPADEKIMDLMLTHVKDLVMYASLSRRIAFACAGLCGEDSVSSEVNDLLISLLESGKEEGVFRQDMDTGDSADIIRSLYLWTLFVDPEIEKVSMEKTVGKFRRLLEIVLAEICLDAGRS